MAQYQNTVPNQLGQAAVGTSVSVLYTVPPLTRTYLKDIDIANSTAGVLAVSVYLVPAGGTPGVGTTLIPGSAVPPNGLLQWSGTQVLLPGQTIQAAASGPGLSLIASGGEAT